MGVGRRLGPPSPTPEPLLRGAPRGAPSSSPRGSRRDPNASLRFPAAPSSAASPLSEAAAAPRPEAAWPRRRCSPTPRPVKSVGDEQAAASRPGPTPPVTPDNRAPARPPRPGFPPPPDAGLTRILRLISVPISMAPGPAVGSAPRRVPLTGSRSPAPSPQPHRLHHRHSRPRALRDPPPPARAKSSAPAPKPAPARTRARGACTLATSAGREESRGKTLESK